MSSISISVLAMGTAMNTRMAIGITVQMISTLVLWTSVLSASAPCDFRNLTIE
jgi:hypothetical protein